MDTRMPLKDHERRAALADKYGWFVLGWAVQEDNPAGITLQSKWDSSKFLRMQHQWSLKEWEKLLKQNEQIKPKGWKDKKPPKAKTFDDVMAENKRLKAKLRRLKK
jgi:hypothetical protein